jgi:hypothetical protein
LFEEKWHVRSLALIADFENPCCVHRPSAWARFSAHDHPIDTFEIQAGQRAKQRLEREELDHSTGLAKVVNAECVVLILDAHTHPYVRLPREQGGKLQQAL